MIKIENLTFELKQSFLNNYLIDFLNLNKFDDKYMFVCLICKSHFLKNNKIKDNPNFNMCCRCYNDFLPHYNRLIQNNVLNSLKIKLYCLLSAKKELETSKRILKNYEYKHIIIDIKDFTRQYIQIKNFFKFFKNRKW